MTEHDDDKRREQQLLELLEPPWLVRRSKWGSRRWLAGRLAEEPGLFARFYELWNRRQQLRPEARAELDRARAAMAGIPGRSTAYDAVWSAIHQIRHDTCLHGTTEDRIFAIGDVRADLEYHKDKATHEKKLQELYVQLLGHVEAGTPADRVGQELAHLSRIAAEERESAWRKVNRVMDRRRRAAWSLALLTLLLVLLLPAVLHPAALDDAAGRRLWLNTSVEYLLLAVCGAIGGLLSGLHNNDQVNLPSTQHRLEQLAFRLRPWIGASAALVMVLSLESGLFNFPMESASKGGIMLMAVAAGFSERLLLGAVNEIEKSR